jgi:PAS domain S-box-containing protein
MKPVRESALKRGYRSLAAFPFALDTKNAGVITFYASVSGFFTDQIVRLLDEQSSDLSFAFVTFDHEEQRITAENDLKTSELQYRRLFQTAQDAILILDGDTGKVIDANKFILDMLGYPLEYFVGKHLWELGFIKDKSIAQNAFTELKTNGYIRYEDIPLEKNNGQSFNVEFISNVYLVGDKKIIQCNIRDITDKKMVQDALRASEIRYRRLFETAQDGILILDAGTGQIVEVNPFLIRMLGFSHEQFLGKKLWEIGIFKDIVANKDNFEELQQKAYIRYEDLPLETADGRYINVEFISNVYLAGTKKIIQCNIRDITARKRAEAALAESDARLNSILEGSPMMQFVIDKDHRVISWNKALEECSGVKKAEVLGTRIPWMAFYDTERPVLADLLVDEKVELLPEWYQGTVTHSRLVEGAYETTDFFPKLGVSGMWLYFTAAPIRNANGAIIGAVETLEDITERKLAEKALL